MDRSLQYLFGGVASTALIAGAIAAFLSIAALVGSSSFPSGNSVRPPSGPNSVRIAQPQLPIAAATPAALRSASAPAAVRQLASVGRGLSGSAVQSGPGAASPRAAGPAPDSRSGGG